MVALLLCGSGGAAAQMQAQRLAAWSQAIMRRRIADAQEVEAAKKAKPHLAPTMQPPPSDLPLAPKMDLPESRSRSRWRALERAAGP